MAIRFQTEFTSDNGDSYKIEIHDSAWLGGVYDFRVDSRGFELEYTGETDDIVSPIIGSRLCIGAYSNDGQFETFIDSLKQYQENRYRIVVRRSATIDVVSAFANRVVADGGTIEAQICVADAVGELGGQIQYQLFWAGWIVQDLITIEDASQPYIYEITATDGLNRLSGIDYDSANDITQNDFGLTRVTDVIMNALTDTGLTDLWSGTDAFLETSVDWWEYNQTYSTTDDTLYLTAIDAGLFTSRDDDGNVVRTSAFEVLRQLATLYNSRLFLSNGRFVFEQIGNRATSSRYAVQYDTTGAELATLIIGDDIPLNQTLFGARLAGNQWNFLPALKKVSVNYTQRFLSPWFGAYRFENGDTEFTPGFVAGGEGVQLALYGPINYAITCSNRLEFGNDTNQLVVIFRVEIRVEDSSNPGTYWYFNRPFNSYTTAVTFGTAGWSTTAGYYYFDMPITSVYESIGSTYLLNTITTSDIPVTGTLRVRFELHNKYDLANSGAVYVLDTGIGQSETWNAVMAFSRVDDGSEPANGEVYTSTNSSTSVSSNLTLELGDIVIADGALQTGDLVVWNGSAWVASSKWSKGTPSPSGSPILKLLVSETLAVHALPIQRYDGNVLTSGLFEQRLTFGGVAYLRMNGTFTANVDQWSGTLFAIQRIKTDIATIDPVPLDRTPAGKASGTTGANNTPNELTAGKVGGMSLDAPNQRIGPYQQTTTGARINGTANITGVATMERTTIIGLESFVDTFAARVTADGGTIESETCVSDAITALAGDSFVSLIETDISAPLTAAEAVTMKKTLDVVGRTATEYVQLDTSFTPNGEQPGAIFWNDDTGTAAIVMADGEFLDTGEKSVWHVKNQSGSTIAKGTAVAASGTLGASGRILITPMKGDGTIPAKYFLGLANADIASGEDGYIVSRGKIRQLDTSAFEEGAVLWVHPTNAGELTATEPSAPNLKLPVAFVVYSDANGTLSIRQTAGTYLAESHDVEIGSPVSGELLSYTGGNRWENVELGDLFNATDDYASQVDGSSFSKFYGANKGNVMGDPAKWFRITIGGTDYVIPLYLPAP